MFYFGDVMFVGGPKGISLFSICFDRFCGPKGFFVFFKLLDLFGVPKLFSISDMSRCVEGPPQNPQCGFIYFHLFELPMEIPYISICVQICCVPKKKINLLFQSVFVFFGFPKDNHIFLICLHLLGSPGKIFKLC